MDRQLIVFLLADEQYGLDILAVDSIIRMQPIIRVPHAPGFVEGLTSLRGAVLPVIDLRKRFGLSGQKLDGPFPGRDARSETRRIVIVELGGVRVGMLVDAVLQVVKVPAQAIEPPAPIIMTPRSGFISGIAKLGERLIILLDLDRVLTRDEETELQDFQAQDALQAITEPTDDVSTAETGVSTAPGRKK